MRPAHLVAIACLVGLIAAVPRLADLTQPSLNTDEVKWITRGTRLVRLLREGRPLRATAHLGHPGVPPAAAIGAFERFGQRLGDRFDPIVAGRLPSALVGAAIPALTFLAGARLWAPEVGALAGLLLAFEHRHLATCRTAHIDIFFSLFYLCALWSFWRHVETAGTRYGFFFAASLALAQATRTSGILVLVTVIVFAVVLRIRRRETVLRLAHFYWALLALGFFLVVFGKLWLPPATIDRMQRYGAPAWVDATLSVLTGVALWAPLSAAALLGAAGWRLRRGVAGALLLVLALVLVAAVLAPDLVHNLSGYAMNILHSRSRLHHRYYGASASPPPGKYLTVLASGMPLPTFLSLLLALPLLALESWRTRGETGRFGLLLVTAVFCFLGFASVLSKVAFRYLMPIVPLLDLAVAWLWWRATASLPPIARRTVLGAVAAIVAVLVWPAAPNYAAWESSLGRTLRTELDLPPPLAAEGHEDAARYLWDHAGGEARVLTLCYDDVLRFYWNEVLPRRSGEPPRPLPRFGFYRPSEADFIVLSARRRRDLPDEVAAFVSAHEPALRVTVDGEAAMEVYEVPRG